jgi:hypothetical protein
MDISTTPPTITGTVGRAWSVHVKTILEKQGIPEYRDATVAWWLVEAAWAHPLWHSYWLCLVHLRPLPECEVENIIYLEGATHEMWLYALDPEASRQEMMDSGRVRPLLPVNFAAQLVEESDASAAERILAAVRDICAGRLSPDTDFVQRWKERFGDSMIKG